MVAPLIGAGIRAAARMAAKKAPTKKAKEEARKKAQEEVREKAMKEAKAETKDGVKTTEYPYIEPEKAIRNIQERNPVRAGSGPRLVDEIIDKMEYKKGGISEVFRF
jgi:adenine-specific DNA methylase